MRLRSRTRAAGLLLAALLVAAAGCQNKYKARAVVKGKVTLGPKHLTAGTVVFTTKDNREGRATIDQDGSYNMTDAPIGDVVITVSVPKTQQMMPGMGMHGREPPKGLPPMQPPGGGGGMGPPIDPTKFDPSKIVPIPDKYSDPQKSGLTYTVKKGDQTHDIPLTPETSPSPTP